MSGSKSIKERSFLLNNCYRIVFNSNWSKKRFLQNMKSDAINSEKLIVIIRYKNNIIDICANSIPILNEIRFKNSSELL